MLTCDLQCLGAMECPVFYVRLKYVRQSFTCRPLSGTPSVALPLEPALCCCDVFERRSLSLQVTCIRAAVSRTD